MTKRAEPLIMIDLLRFTCAAMVLVYHFLTTSWLDPGPAASILLAGYPAPSEGAASAMRFNWIGVQLFFVISGIVISASADGAQPLDFMKRRVLRLLPAALICATVTALVLWIADAAPRDLFARWAGSVLLIPRAPLIDPVYWTLGAEVMFYLAVTYALFKTSRLDHVAMILLTLSGIFWLATLAADRAFGIGYIETELAVTLLPHGCFFALGILLANTAQHGWTRRGATAVTIALCICCVQVTRLALWRGTVLQMEALPMVPLGLFLLGTGALAAAWRIQPHLARRIHPDTARAIGLMTYPVYLIHQEVGAVIMASTIAAGLDARLAVAAAVIVTVSIGWLIAAYIEPPVRRGLKFALERLAASLPSREPALRLPSEPTQ